MIKQRDTKSYFNGLLENINIILNNPFYKTEDKKELKNLKTKIENWYQDYTQNHTLKNISPKELENIDLEITDFFDKYIEIEPVKENNAERLLYDFEQLETNWKNEMLGGKK